MHDPLNRIVTAAKEVMEQFSSCERTVEQNAALVELASAVDDMEQATAIINAEVEKMTRMLDNEPGANPFSAFLPPGY